MAALRKQLRESRLRTFDSKRFIPEGVVDDILTQQNVQDTVAAFSLEIYKIPETEEQILNGGKKIFVILLLISQAHKISKFIESD